MYYHILSSSACIGYVKSLILPKQEFQTASYFQKTHYRRPTLENHNSFVIYPFLSPFSAIVSYRKVFSKNVVKSFTLAPDLSTFSKNGQQHIVSVKNMFS